MTRRCCVLLALLAGVVPACDAAATTILDTPTAKLLAPDGALGDLFGFALALDEGAAVIGAFSHSDVPGAMDATGAAYVFDADSGTLRFELRPGDLMPGDTIGLLVGADAGEALVFGGRGAYRFDTATAQELGKIDPIANLPGNRRSQGEVPTDGGLAALAYTVGDPTSLMRGDGVRVFRVADGATVVDLLSDDWQPMDEFGTGVAISNGVALVTAAGESGGAGAAYLFDAATGQQLRKFAPADRVAGDAFGVGVALDGDTAVVGAGRGFTAPAAGAYVFDVATGAEVARLSPEDPQSLASFGGLNAVAVDDGLALIGARGLDGRGAAYLFDAATGDQLAKLVPPAGVTGTLFGDQLVLDDGVALVGAYLDNERGIAAGAAYLFDVSAFVIPEPTAVALALLGVAAIARRR